MTTSICEKLLKKTNNEHVSIFYFIFDTISFFALINRDQFQIRQGKKIIFEVYFISMFKFRLTVINECGENELMEPCAYTCRCQHSCCKKF